MGFPCGVHAGSSTSSVAGANTTTHSNGHRPSSAVPLLHCIGCTCHVAPVHCLGSWGKGVKQPSQGCLDMLLGRPPVAVTCPVCLQTVCMLVAAQVDCSAPCVKRQATLCGLHECMLVRPLVHGAGRGQLLLQDNGGVCGTMPHGSVCHGLRESDMLRSPESEQHTTASSYCTLSHGIMDAVRCQHPGSSLHRAQ